MKSKIIGIIFAATIIINGLLIIERPDQKLWFIGLMGVSFIAYAIYAIDDLEKSAYKKGVDDTVNKKK